MISEEIMKRIQNLDEALFETSREMFAMGEERQPALICVVHKNPAFERVILPVDNFMETEATKNALSKFIRLMIARPEVDIVVVISEAWFMARTKEQREAEGNVAPKDVADRREGVIFAYTLKEGGAISNHEMERVDGKITLKRGKLSAQAGGRFVPNGERESDILASLNKAGSADAKI